MKKVLLAVIAASLLAGSAYAEGSMGGGLGFRSLAAGPSNVLINTGVDFSTSPAIGMRHWISERAGFDAAVGFVKISGKAGSNSVTVDDGTGFVFDVGVPISAKKWDKVNVIFRPGFVWGQAKATDKLTATAPNELKATVIAATGELEVELMLAEKLSVSAAHGIAYRQLKFEDNDTPKSELKFNGFQTSGDNFTTLGFHVYLW